METTIVNIDAHAKRYADSRRDLCRILTELDTAVEALKKAKLSLVNAAAEKAGHRKEELKTLIDGNRHLFVSPRTLVLHGIKVGLQKGKGAITFSDPDRVVELIERHFPEQLEQLIKTTKTPIKSGLKTLTVGDLKRIACKVEETGDQVVIQPAKSEADKRADAIIDEVTSEAA